MNTHIRRATEHDIESISAVGQASFTWAFGHLFYNGLGFENAGTEFYEFEKVRTEFRLLTKQYGKPNKGMEPTDDSVRIT